MTEFSSQSSSNRSFVIVVVLSLATVLFGALYSNAMRIDTNAGTHAAAEPGAAGHE